jgi:hypothetical protein
VAGGGIRPAALRLVAADLRRGLPGDVEIGDVNQGHWRLALDHVKLTSSVVMTHRRWRFQGSGDARVCGRRRAGALGG